MKLSRITKIRERGVFHDFTWPQTLLPFARFNLIYGWNGAGKTTLSALFRHLQDRQALTHGSVEFELDEATKLPGKDIPARPGPEVRVFDRDFVSAAIVAAGSKFEPIYFLGKDSVEKSKEVDRLRRELTASQTAAGEAQGKKKKTEDAADAFCISNAKLIKEVLTGPRSPGYNNYDKRRFRQSLQALTPDAYKTALLSDSERDALRQQKDSAHKSAVALVTDAVPDLEKIASRAKALLEKSVLSETLSELVSDPAVGSWVQRGLDLHSGERQTDMCRFCAQKIPLKRRKDLEAHFSDALARFQRELDGAAQAVAQEESGLGRVTLPSGSDLYDHLQAEWADVAAQTGRALAEMRGLLGMLHEALLRKKDAPFGQATLPSELDGQRLPDARESLLTALRAANAILTKHNVMANDFQKEVDRACSAIEQSYVAAAYEEYQRLMADVAKASEALQQAERRPGTLQARIDELERVIREHRRPAEELNAELKAYLGRDELRFEVKETGYALTRAGLPAHNLSEGERTAIAFLYFLKSLQDRSFDLAKSIVVVDDPVSSLDANALFSAFGYMKERTKDAGQLFVFTHNFAFFRQVRSWFHHQPKQNSTQPTRRPSRFYYLRAASVNGRRAATLGPLDRLLEEYESEYHYLFKLVHEEAARADTDSGLEQHYSMPNIARRLVESFLSFRYPDATGDLIRRMERAEFDATKKTRILRLLNTYSHSNGIAEPEHDLSLLSETRPVLREILEMIKALDRTHYDGMVKAVTPSGAGEEE